MEFWFLFCFLHDSADFSIFIACIRMQVKGSVLLSPILVVVVELAELATCFRPRKSTLTYPGIRGVGKKLSLLFLDSFLFVHPREGNKFVSAGRQEKRRKFFVKPVFTSYSIFYRIFPQNTFFKI